MCREWLGPAQSKESAKGTLQSLNSLPRFTQLIRAESWFKPRHVLCCLYHDGFNMANTQRPVEITVRAHSPLSCLEGWKVHMRQTVFIFFLSLSPCLLPSIPPFFPSLLSIFPSLSLIITIAVDTHLFWFDAIVMTQYRLKKKPQTLAGQETWSFITAQDVVTDHVTMLRSWLVWLSLKPRGKQMWLIKTAGNV